MHRLVGLINRHTQLYGRAKVTDLLLRNILGSNKYIQELSKNADEIYNFINKVIEGHRKNFDPENLNDLIDMWLNEIRLHKSDDPCSYLNPDNMPGLIFLLFLAGTDSTALALLWSCQYLVRYPEVQDRIHREIDEVVGRKELPPTFSDRLNLPYTQAVLAEVQRVGAGRLPSFKVAADTTNFRGYTIPKNTAP